MKTATQAPAAGLFDAVGRLIPLGQERVYGSQDRAYFRLKQPTLDLTRITERFQKYLPGFKESAELVEKKCTELRTRIEGDAKIASLFKGVHVPFVIPPAGPEGWLRQFRDLLEGPLARSFRDAFPQYTFTNYLKETFPSEAPPIKGSRYEQVVDTAGALRIGWYFPGALRGFAIPDQRTLMSRLPEPLILSGPLEAAAALIGSPDLLMNHDHYPNLLALAAVRHPRPHMFYFFEAYGWNLTCNERSMIGAVSEYYSGGLTLL